MKSSYLLFLICLLAVSVYSETHDGNATNPLIWADIPDPDILRFGDTYYMSSTTMHMSPGVPIMKSSDLVNWKTVSYAYDILADNDALNLTGGKNAYGKGSWASCIRYHNNLFYVYTFSYTTQKTHVYTTTDIENGQWESHTISPDYHDLSVLFDDNGVFCVYGNNDIQLVELTDDGTSVKQGGIRKTIISNASSVAGSGQFYVQAEGSHIYKINGKYYLFLITWPAGEMRTQLVYRANTITGPWEGRVALRDNGVAQGGIVETSDGRWYALLFRDNGAVGRIPWLVPVDWEDGWPVFGTNNKIPATLDLPAADSDIGGIVASDDFDYDPTEPIDLQKAWQWNHNPLDEYWSVTDRAGFLRLVNDRVDTDMPATRNTLTQRTFGPECSATTAVDVSNMKDGDYAGLGALQEKYGFIGVKMEGESKSVVMVNHDGEVERHAVDQDTIYLRIDMDFRNQNDKATFFFSRDAIDWETAGTTLNMEYTLSHFMGYRFALFTYATKTAGGYADFDYFKVGHTFDKALPTTVHTVQFQRTPIAEVSACIHSVSGTTEYLQFTVPSSTHIRMSLFNLNGQNAALLTNGYQQSGRYRIALQKYGLHCGRYLLQTTTGRRHTTVKPITIFR